MEQIARYHITPGEQNHLSKKGAPGIAYHYVIEKDGSVFYVTDEKYLTWHVAKKNTWSIGILVVGNFSAYGRYSSEEPTSKQLASLKKFFFYIQEKYPDAKIVGHCEIASASHPKPYCPGTTLMKEIQEYRDKNSK
jgi:N-acetyl-anhydromuramyl-L-alanine amidase AmpD